MSKSFKKDLTGKKFGRLTVIKFVPCPEKEDSYWLCKCDCNNEKIVKGGRLASGNTTSCGCFQKEVAAKKRLKHGETRTRLHVIWCDMRGRCHSIRHNRYKDYGGRGVTVCDEWRNDFVAFRDWALANGYRDYLVIDRIDLNGGYCPENCRWTTSAERRRNRRKYEYANLIIQQKKV